MPRVSCSRTVAVASTPALTPLCSAQQRGSMNKLDDRHWWGGSPDPRTTSRTRGSGADEGVRPTSLLDLRQDAPNPRPLRSGTFLSNRMRNALAFGKLLYGRDETQIDLVRFCNRLGRHAVVEVIQRRYDWHSLLISKESVIHELDGGVGGEAAVVLVLSIQLDVEP